MIVKGRSRASKKFQNIYKRIKPSTRIKLLFLVLMMIFLGSLLGYKKVLKPRMQYYRDRGITVRSLLEGYYYKLTTVPEKTLDIDVGFESWEKIRNKRNEAMVSGVLLALDEDFVPARIRYKDQNVPVDMRLKGDWADHFDRGKWSLRIEVDDDKTFLGMDRFSLQAPETRQNLNEWLFLKALGDESVIALNYDFVQVVINGEESGIYAIEEHFSKHVLERNKMREGPILKFDEDFLWEKLKALGGSQFFSINPQVTEELFDAAEVSVFGPAKIAKSEALREQYDNAYTALGRYLGGSLAPEMVFDYESWATYLALVDLFGADHGLIWHNLRLYWNPVTARLEPIPFDNVPGRNTSKLVTQVEAPGPLTRMMNDNNFLSLYRKKLEYYSKEEYGAEVIGKYEDQVQKFEKLIRRDNSNYSFSAKFLKDNAKTIRGLIDGKRSLRATVAENETGQMDLILTNVSAFPIEVIGVKTTGGMRLAQTTKIVPVNKGNKENEVEERLRLLGFVPIQIDYRLLGSEETEVTVVERPLRFMTVAGWRDIGSLPGVEKSSLLGTIKLPAGQVRIDAPVVVPEGFSLDAGPGTSIELSNGASIIAYGGVNLVGVNGNPVRISSTDMSGGLVVINAKGESQIAYAEFNNLSNLKAGGMETTGAVTFYNSDVNIENTVFDGTNAEDMLNLILSSFKLTKVSLANTYSDALDVDFGIGTMVDVIISEAGNDCLDFSGSDITVNRFEGNSCGDKGISVGEKSVTLINESTLDGGRLGLASKDSSEVTLEGIKITDFEVGLAAYQKKPEFGPGKIIVGNGFDLVDVGTSYLIERGSELFINGQSAMGSEENLGVRFE